MTKTVVVGMSGGVDSSVAAFLLKEQGYHVIGLFMKNWEDDDNCLAAHDYADVVAVCSQLQIPHYAVNFSQNYWEKVFQRCLVDFELGFTPNPDILCNQEIKFKVFFQQAMDIKADYLATGHYCQNRDGHLLRGVDAEKDQSYFLYTIQENILHKILFPIGGLTKKEVRHIAREAGLPTAEKKDSTGICFIGKRNFKEFLAKYIEETPGNFETLDGEIVGQHDGHPFYTIGQRKGLKIGGPGAAWYVVGKDINRNVVHVAQGEEHPALYQVELIAEEVHWINGSVDFPFKCQAKIRYRSSDAACEVFSLEKDRVSVRFAMPQKAITPRQAIVFYDGAYCLGGGLIASAN